MWRAQGPCALNAAANNNIGRSLRIAEESVANRGNNTGCSLVLMSEMWTFLLWLLLLVVCWPLALLALIAYPIVWVLLLPFKLLGIAVGGVLEFLKAIIMLPAKAVRALTPA